MPARNKATPGRMRLRFSLPPWAAIGLVAGLFAIPSSNAADPVPGPGGAINVNAVAAKSGAIPVSLVLPAQIVAYQSAVLTARVAGYLKAIAVDKGDEVKAGALIAELEVPELVADRMQFKAQADVARSNYDRMQQAAKTAPDLITPQSLDEAKGKLQVAQAQLDRTETLLRYARITAPFSGTITGRYADPGAYIPVATTSGQQSAAVVSLMDFSRVRIQVPVPENDASKVTKGTQAAVTAKGLPGKEIAGTVTRIGYALDQNSRTMLAEIELDNPGGVLRPGMYASVRLVVSSPQGTVLIPTGAIVNDGGNSFVYSAVNGKAVKTPVRLGNKNDKETEVISGLVSGQLAILPEKQTLADGAAVSATVKQ